MSKPPRQSETRQASADASLDDRLDSLMADLEKDLQHLDPQPEDSPSVCEAVERAEIDIESSAAQLMRELNDALNAVEHEVVRETPAPGADGASDEELDACDLQALDEALATGAQSTTIDERHDGPLPSDPEELAAALDESDEAEVLPEPESEAGEDTEDSSVPDPEPEPEPQATVAAAPSPPRSREDQPEAVGAATPAQPIESAAPAPAPSPRLARLHGLALKIAHILALPLAVFPPTVRDYIGWFGIVTLINAGALWTFWLLFRA